MAWEADMEARPGPIANKEAASIFIGISFCRYAMKMILLKKRLRHLTGDDGASAGGANDDASDGDASGGGASDDDASAPARA